MLVTTCAGRLRALALRILHDHADADDAVQQTFLTAFRRWSTFRGDADPCTWLYAIATRTCLARLKRRRRDARPAPPLTRFADPTSFAAVMPWTESAVTALAAAPTARDQDPAALAQRDESIARVQAAIARLPDHLRLALTLKDVLELPTEHVGAILGLATNTVKTRVHRARLALRKSLLAAAPKAPAPAPIYDKQVCFDLLNAKLASLDRARGPDAAHAFDHMLPRAEVCARCRAVFRELDIVHDACAQLGAGDISPALRDSLLAAIAANADQSTRARGVKPTTLGRRPVARSRDTPSRPVTSRTATSRGTSPRTITPRRPRHPQGA